MSSANETTAAFYDPHPGLLGAVVPIPSAVKRIANALNGKTLPLREAVAQLQAVTRGRIEVVSSSGHQYIRLWIPGDGRPYLGHCFRVIRFREVHHAHDQS